MVPSPVMLRQILTDRQEVLLAELRGRLVELGTVLDTLSAEADRRALDAAARPLDTLFLMVVVGGTGLGAERLTDALLGRAVLAGRSAGAPARLVRRAGGADLEGVESVELLTEDLPVLRRLAVATVPGGESAGWFGRADLALVLTSARHPLGEGERPLLLAAADGASRVLVVIDDMDMLRLSEDVDRMEEAVEVTAERILGRRVPAFGISGARVSELPAPTASLVPALARQVETALRAPEIVGPKLRHPAETGLALARERRKVVEEELRRWSVDLENLAEIEAGFERFEESARAALGDALDAVDGAFTELSSGARGFVRRWTRPFPLAGRRRLAERFEAGPGGAVRKRLEEEAEALERRLGEAAESARSGIFARLEAHPTERLEAHPVADGDGAGAPVTEMSRERSSGRSDRGSPAVALEELHAEPTGRTVLTPLRRSGRLALALLAAGVLFAAVPFVWGLMGDGSGTGGVGPVPVALGGGLGGAAVLAALGVLKLRRRSLFGSLPEWVEERRLRAADALTALAEERAAAERRRIRDPVADYAETVSGERNRLEGARDELARLEGALEGLLRRLE